MNTNDYLELLDKKVKDKKPIKIGLIGCGKFGTMFLNQSINFSGIKIVGIADLKMEKILSSLERIGWPRYKIEKKDITKSYKNSSLYITQDVDDLINCSFIDIIIEATGDPIAGSKHILKSIKNNINIISVTVESDALLGPILKKEADRNNVIYSLAYGDQPSLITELVEWANLCNLEVVCVGKGTKYLPDYHYSTPDSVWKYYGLSKKEAEDSGLNPKMFNSFLDGTKSAIEMCAVSNSTGLIPQKGGLKFIPCSVDELPSLCKPISNGGKLSHKGTVEVVSSLRSDGSEVDRDLRWGVFIVFEANNDYTEKCFKEYGIRTDESGQFAALYRPYHLIGLELMVSVVRIGLLCLPTGFPKGFRGDAVAVAKKDLSKGDFLDGEGGYSVYGKLMQAEDSKRLGAFPIGLTNKVKIKNNIKKDSIIRWSDIIYDKNDPVIKLRKEMEKMFI